MTSRCGFLKIDDLTVIHPGKVVVGFVIFSDVIPAEMIILVLNGTLLRRAVRPLLCAVCPLAILRSRLRFSAASPAAPAYADAVKIFRFEFHLSKSSLVLRAGPARLTF